MVYGYLFTMTNSLFIIGEIKEFFKDTIYSGYVDCIKTNIDNLNIFRKIAFNIIKIYKTKTESK